MNLKELEELDSLTKKIFAERDPGEDSYCCTAMREQVVNCIREGIGLVPLENTAEKPPMTTLIQHLRKD